MMNALTVANTPIRQDAEGRYCLNDLYHAAGGQPRHRPSEWLRNKQTQALVVEIDADLEAGIPASKSTRGHGVTATYVVKELVYAYAMRVNPAFHLKVIRAYDALVTGEYIRPGIQHENYWFARRPHWLAIRERVLAGERYRDIAAALGRSVGSIARAVRRMIAVGLLAPAKVAAVQRGPARAAALKLAGGWGEQLPLALEL